MARGLQKVESQKKAQEAAAKKAGGKSNLKERSAAFKISCPRPMTDHVWSSLCLVSDTECAEPASELQCMIGLVDYKTFKQHFEAKHPKDPLPAEETVLKA
ncbi:BZ3500_MvSof-1268-A1-R1_Chr3-1g05502 [Microbotryum saponariae]|uniref:BZ3500_MvSof-1268-A1-R1_Chr3-1g05502 protein n=1 Tax=Microbotryum saponariae TaxID=289078 RepID=A0A2X0L2N1_9BASI|nr:BZ3500_MvSof-1268-A1-R1_Chr3-1g05502 [Microbotryum saponariae]SDA04693.1 BZ3501_MvSof-1269-A2-R1_Chr3-1g05173 [Microbotryum saponariae]